jgi:hypothetical protein
MLRHIPILLLVLGGIAQSACAQSATPPATQLASSPGTRVTLVVQRVDLSDNFDDRVGTGLPKLPKLGAQSICDWEQAKFLLAAAAGDKRSNLTPVQTVTMPDGETRPMSPFGPRKELQAAAQAAVTNDRQAIAVHLTWAKKADGKESLPTMTATVQIGSCLLIHTHELMFAPPPPPVSAWQKLVGHFVPRACVGVGREKRQVYLLISPRIAAADEKEPQVAAK